MISKRNLIIIAGMSILLLAACSNKPSYSDGSQVNPNVTSSVTPSEQAQTTVTPGSLGEGEIRIPEGDGNVEIPRGSGSFFEIEPVEYDPFKVKKTYAFRINQEVTEEERLKLLEEVYKIEGVEKTMSSYEYVDCRIEVFVSDVNPEFVKYREAAGENWNGLTNTIQIFVGSYDGCEETTLFQSPPSMDVAQTEGLYSGGSILNYTSGDKVKIKIPFFDAAPGSAEFGSAEINEIEYEFVIDEYKTLHSWWLDGGYNSTPLLLIPYEKYEEIFHDTWNEKAAFWRLYYVRCSEEVKEGFKSELQEILGNQGDIRAIAFFERL